MGTHPIFESDFDCLTEMADRYDNGCANHIILTGPNGVRNHRGTVEEEHREVGIGQLTDVQTSEIDYITRMKAMPFDLYSKKNLVGSIGWRNEKAQLTTAREAGFMASKRDHFE